MRRKSKRVKVSRVNNKQGLPRLVLFRSLKHIYAQILAHSTGVVLAQASSLKGDVTGNVDSAKAVGKAIAEAALKAKVEKIVFDRGVYVYRGRVKALADSAREHGLVF